MNSVHLGGRLATYVEVKEVNGGSKVSSFILAVDRSAEEADYAFLRRAWRLSLPKEKPRPKIQRGWMSRYFSAGSC